MGIRDDSENSIVYIELMSQYALRMLIAQLHRALVYRL